MNLDGKNIELILGIDWLGWVIENSEGSNVSGEEDICPTADASEILKQSHWEDSQVFLDLVIDKLVGKQRCVLSHLPNFAVQVSWTEKAIIELDSVLFYKSD